MVAKCMSYDYRVQAYKIINGSALCIGFEIRFIVMKMISIL